jgi:hypothetical protein
MMIETASTLLSAFNGVSEIAKSLIGIRDAAMIDSKIAELMGKILEANSIAFNEQLAKQALSEKISVLEKEILSFKNWETDKTKYYLRNIGGGAFVYALKDEPMNEGETFHQICTNCYEKRQKSILQREARSSKDTTTPIVWYYLFCNNCKNRLQIHNQSEKITFTYLRPAEAFI